MSRLTLGNISHSFGGRTALEAVSLTVEAGSLTALTGPSGSGKTTLLRIAAGLLAPEGGEVSLSPMARPVLVFQDNLLFPHLKVLGNVTFGPRAQKKQKSQAEAQARVLLDRLGIGDKAESWPGELSAGQQQRVALARALAAEPGVLLLDEPFANLDRELRLETARFVRELQRERGLTVLLVTHGQEEAFAVADRIALLRGGRLVQEGSAEDFRLRPADLETARFSGEVNLRAGPQGTHAFRAAETTLVPSPDGPARVVASEWTGQGFRTTALWEGILVTALATTPPPPPGTPVRVDYTPLTFQENL